MPKFEQLSRPAPEHCEHHRERGARIFDRRAGGLEVPAIERDRQIVSERGCRNQALL